MKKDNKKALYESIMASVAKEVKKVLNEDTNNINEESVKLLYKQAAVCLIDYIQNMNEKFRDQFSNDMWKNVKCHCGKEEGAMMKLINTACIDIEEKWGIENAYRDRWKFGKEFMKF